MVDLVDRELLLVVDKCIQRELGVQNYGAANILFKLRAYILRWPLQWDCDL